jgi:hypothetical protein
MCHVFGATAMEDLMERQDTANYFASVSSLACDGEDGLDPCLAD